MKDYILETKPMPYEDGHRSICMTISQVTKNVLENLCNVEICSQTYEKLYVINDIKFTIVEKNN